MDILCHLCLCSLQVTLLVLAFALHHKHLHEAFHVVIILVNTLSLVVARLVALLAIECIVCERLRDQDRRSNKLVVGGSASTAAFLR